MKFKELKEKATKDLHELLKEKREQSRALRFSIFSDQEKHVRKIRSVKKQIAQILTILNNKKQNNNSVEKSEEGK
ncbi:MAG TPA: 50S ribosomal protein L29 [bacterium]|nr:50S ribosomal protein L29 [bacterium]